MTLINLIRNNDFVNHITKIRVDFKYDVNCYHIYRQLENTGLKFEWIR